MQRYYKSSSLPFTEKRKHKPEVCKYRRDRVLHAIMNREMERVLRIIGARQPARKGGHNDSLSWRADNT
ncbi:DUF7301 family protein [Erwinia aphidicola]